MIPTHMLTGKGEISPLDKELQATKESWEQEVVLPREEHTSCCPVVSSENMHTSNTI